MSDQTRRTELRADEASLLLPHERGGAEPEQNTLSDGFLDEILGEEMDPGVTEDQDEVRKVSDEEEAFDAEEVSDEDEDSEDHREPVDPEAIAFVDEDGEPVTAEEARLGYLRQSDYTRKGQALSEERKQTVQAREQAMGEIQKVNEALQDVEVVLSQMAGSPPDPRLREQNPGEYAAQIADHQNRQQMIQALRQRRAQEAQKLEQMQAQQMQDIMAEEQRKLKEKLPEWRDPQTQDKELGQIAEHFMSEYDYTPQELRQVQDHRAMVIMRKAMLYDQLQAKGQDTLADPPKGKVKKSQSRPRPKGKKRSRGQDGRFQRSRKKALQERSARLSETGSVQDAALAIETLLGDELL